MGRMAVERTRHDDRAQGDGDGLEVVAALKRSGRRLGLLGPPPPRQLTLFDLPASTDGKGARGALAGSLSPYWSSAPDSRPVAPDGSARLLLAMAILIYVWIFSYWTMRNHDGFATWAFDLGIYDQGLWLLSRFKSPFITIMGRNLFGDHTSFILLPLAPFYWVFPSAKVILFAQAAALGGAALPAFLLAREKLRHELLALGIAVAYLLQPAVGYANFEQFHPDVFEVPLALFAFWFMVKKRWVGYFVCVGGLLLVKEDVGLLTCALGVYVALKHDRRVGLTTIGISVLYFAAAFWWILPALNGVGTLNQWRIPFGGPSGVVRTAILEPGKLLSYLTSDGRPWYVWQLLAPMGLLAVLAPSVALIAIGPMASNVLSTFWYQYHIQYHYTTLIVPVVVVATIFAIAKARSMAVRTALVSAVVGCSLVTAYVWGPTTFSSKPAGVVDPSYPTFANLRAAIKLVPRSAVVSSHYAFVPHLDHRERIYMFPTPFKAAYWGTFRQEGQRLPEADSVEYVIVPKDVDADQEAAMEAVRRDFRVIYDAPNVLVFKRVAS